MPATNNEGIEEPITLEEAQNIFETHFGKELASWQFPEYDRHVRGKWWYIFTFCVLTALLVWAIISLNYLFAVILIIFTFIVTMHHYQEPAQVDFILCESGVIVGRDYYPFEEIENFWIINDSPFPTKVMMQKKNRWKSRIIVPIIGQDLNVFRDTLLQFLPENTETPEDSFSDIVGKLLRI